MKLNTGVLIMQFDEIPLLMHKSMIIPWYPEILEQFETQIKNPRNNGHQNLFD